MWRIALIVAAALASSACSRSDEATQRYEQTRFEITTRAVEMEREANALKVSMVNRSQGLDASLLLEACFDAGYPAHTESLTPRRKSACDKILARQDKLDAETTFHLEKLNRMTEKRFTD